MAGPLAGKRIGLLAGWASRANGGVFEALVQQADLIRDLDGEPWVFAAQDEWYETDRERLKDTECRACPAWGPPALAYAPGLIGELYAARLDCLHVHGIWQGNSWISARWARRNPGRTIISPHGMLDPWITGRGRLKKAIFRALVERHNWRAAAAFHALTADEATDIGRRIPTANVTVIANPAPLAVVARRPFPPPEMLFLGRIHEKKNLGALIEGWRLAQALLPGRARLTIAGSGADSDVAELKRQVAEAGPGVRFAGPAYGPDKRALLDQARFMVLPSHSEGLPMAILEAWSTGLPTIMTPACHLPEGFQAGAAIRCGATPSDIARALVAALAAPEEEWRRMSDAAINLATGPFSRETIASRWAGVYGELMDRADNG